MKSELTLNDEKGTVVSKRNGEEFTLVFKNQLMSTNDKKERLLEIKLEPTKSKWYLGDMYFKEIEHESKDFQLSQKDIYLIQKFGDGWLESDPSLLTYKIDPNLMNKQEIEIFSYYCNLNNGDNSCRGTLFFLKKNQSKWEIVDYRIFESDNIDIKFVKRTGTLRDWYKTRLLYFSAYFLTAPIDIVTFPISIPAGLLMEWGRAMGSLHHNQRCNSNFLPDV